MGEPRPGTDVELCPRCALREKDDTHTGFCRPCSEEHLAVRYIEREIVEIDQRRQAWRDKKGSSAEALRLRQHRHRLFANMRPKEPAPPWRDPLELGNDIVRLLKRLRGANARTWSPEAVELMDDAIELVRQLAWGPQP